MSRLNFSDGVSIDTSGEYRIIRQRDGLYVTGHGFLCAVETHEEGVALIKDLDSRREGDAGRKG